MRNSVEQDLPKILDTTLPVRKLFDQTPAFMGRYFWLEDALAEVEHFERTVSATWAKVTGGHSDDSTLLTLFLTVAAGSTPKTLLTEKSAATLVRKIRKSGLKTKQRTPISPSTPRCPTRTTTPSCGITFWKTPWARCKAIWTTRSTMRWRYCAASAISRPELCRCPESWGGRVFCAGKRRSPQSGRGTRSKALCRPSAQGIRKALRASALTPSQSP